MLLLRFLLLLSASASAQQRPALTAADYSRAESFLSYKTDPLVLHPGIRPNWLDDSRFWYRDGEAIIVVDAATGKQNAGGSFATPPAPSTTEVLSPDRKRVAFLRDFNLWV